MAAPDVILISPSSSCAMIYAKVVLPIPGGPYKSRCSETAPRFFTASINKRRVLTIFLWPIYSESIFGRRLVSVIENFFLGIVYAIISVFSDLWPTLSLLLFFLPVLGFLG